jgi:hypothetical protein
MLSSGRPKDRNRADGTIIDLGLMWNAVTFITSNENVTELLSLLEERAVAEATQMRVFEIALSRDLVTSVWSDTNAVDLIEHQLLENYGHAGQAWLRYCIANRATLKDDVRKLRSKYNPTNADDTRERYYRDLISTVIVALKHAAKLGLVKFDLVGVAKWAKGNISKLRVRRSEHTFSADEYISQFLGSLHGKIIVTKHFKDGRGAGMETPIDQLRGEPSARMALDDKLFLVTRRSLTTWCGENRIQPSWLVEEMDRRGLLLARGENLVRKERLGKGTNIPGTPTTCYEFNFGKVFEALKATPEK